MSAQPEALRLADELDAIPETGADPDLIQESAAELRRLHAENERLAAEVANRNRRALAGDEAVSALANVYAYYEKLEAQRDALLEVLLGVEKRCSHSGYVGNDGQFLKVIQAAIAKATGETA